MKIRSLTARAILDSRAQWTVEATIELQDGVRASASVPQGKSMGTAEAHALPAAQAVKNILKIIAPAVHKKTFNSQAAFDSFLIELDGTAATKSKLGANAILATSIAFARACAAANHIPLWQHIREIYGLPVTTKPGVTHPRLFMNLINGGLHGGSNLDVQEYVIIPKTRTFKEAAQIGIEIYHALADLLTRTKGKAATNLGDEGGFSPDFKDNIEPIKILVEIVTKLGYEKKVDFGIDAAATDIKKLNDGQLQTLYEKLIKKYNLLYLEDPFSEEQFEKFAHLTAHFGKMTWIAGDDLTTTNVHRMERAHAEGSVNAVIIKPNQIGSVSEALDAVRAARTYGWNVIVSHRSGETNDAFIADFAYGVGADGLKLGAPARGERIAKYNRLLEIEEESTSR
jgi:enolase